MSDKALEYGEGGYPFWWQQIFWYLPAFKSPWIPCADSGAGDLLVIARIGQGATRPLGSDGAVRQLAVDRLSSAIAPGRLVIWDTHEKGAPSKTDLRNALGRLSSPRVFLLDLDAITDVWSALPVRALGLSWTLRTVPIYVVVWDSLDPVHAWSSQILTRRNGYVVTLGRSAESVTRFGISNSLGAGIDLTSPEVVRESQVLPWAERPWDIYLPPTSHSRRAENLVDLQAAASLRGWNVAPHNAERYEEYLSLFAKARVSVVVNEVRERYTRRTPKKFGVRGGTTHLVARNLEVVAAGGLLVSQRDDTLREHLAPGLEYLEWSTPSEATDLVAAALKNPIESEAIAARARQRLREIVIEQRTSKAIVGNFTP